MNGELLFLDSQAYQMTASNGVRPAPADIPLPFVQVTKFVPEYRVQVPMNLRKDHLMKIFAAGGAEAGGPNSFIPFLLKGSFKSVKARLAGPAEHEGQSLAEVAANAKQFELSNVKGTIFGFVSPAWSQGISVPGVHCHFLTEGETGENGQR